jgi:hypothetical protein
MRTLSRSTSSVEEILNGSERCSFWFWLLGFLGVDDSRSDLAVVEQGSAVSLCPDARGKGSLQCFAFGY